MRDGRERRRRGRGAEEPPGRRRRGRREVRGQGSGEALGLIEPAGELGAEAKTLLVDEGGEGEERVLGGVGLWRRLHRRRCSPSALALRYGRKVSERERVC